jgi:membrane associated rhomboid family serine protease
MMRITDVVKNLLIINVLMYFATRYLWGNPDRFILALFYPTSDFFHPYQLVTHMFMHADINHLLLNMLGLYMFGSSLEAFWGSKKFLFFYLFCGFGSMILYLLVRYLEVGLNVDNTPMLGASGAIFGLMAGYAMLFPNNIISLLFPPISLPAKYFVLIYAAAELFFGLGIVNVGKGVAHFAHLGGALFGFLLILYWRKYGSKL